VSVLFGPLETPEDLVQATLGAYRSSAQEYLRFSNSYANFPELQPLVAEFAQQGTPGPILDVGAGCCRDAKAMERLGRNVIALDACGDLLMLGRDSTPTTVCRLQADMRRLPLHDGSIGGLLCVSALIHVPDGEIPLVLDEFARVLAPRGLLLATVPADPNPGWTMRGAIRMPRWFNSISAHNLQAELARRGFTRVNTIPSGENWCAVSAQASRG